VASNRQHIFRIRHFNSVQLTLANGLFSSQDNFLTGLQVQPAGVVPMHLIACSKRIAIMAEATDRALQELPAEDDDLVSALQRLLQASPHPLTPAKIRAMLPAAFRSSSEHALMECLNRQVAAHVFCQYPKYRSSNDRFWDRPMAVHIADLLRTALEAEPLPWSVLRRRLPVYAQAQAEAVLKDQIKQGLIFRLPRLGRSTERFGLRPAEAKEYLRREIAGLFLRLENLGFTGAQLREGALDLFHEEEWGSSPEIRAVT
jgi:hypothetical protein